MKQRRSPNSSNSDLLYYAGLGFQIFFALGIAVLAGIQADKWLRFSNPVLVLILPPVVLLAIIYKIIRQTSKPRNRNESK